MSVKLVAPSQTGSVTWAGRAYEVVKGTVEVPEEAVAHLHAHGYRLPKRETLSLKGKPKDDAA